MGALILPHRLRQQPQQAAVIDRSNALGAKVIEYLPLGKTIRAEVSGRNGTRGSAGSFAVGLKGRSLRGAGTGVRGSIPLDLSRYKAITIAFWLYWDAYANNDALAMEFGPLYSGAYNGFLVDPNCSAPVGFMFGAGGGGSNLSVFPRPSAGQWHRIFLTLDRAAPVNAVGRAYVDGVSQALTPFGGNTATTGNFSSTDLNLFSRNAASLFGTGNLQDLTIYRGVLSDSEAAADFQNPWQIIKAPVRRVWTKSSVVSPSVTLTPGDSSLTLAGFAPAISQARNFTPSTAILGLSGFSPAIVQPQNLAPGAGSFGITGLTPGISQAMVMNPFPAQIGFTGHAPLVGQATQAVPQTIAPMTGVFGLVGAFPGIALATNLFVGPASIALHSYAPRLSHAPIDVILMGSPTKLRLVNKRLLRAKR